MARSLLQKSTISAEKLVMAEAKSQLISNIFGMLGRPIFVVDHENQKVSFINSAGEELLGFHSKEMIGKPWSKVFDENSVVRIEALLMILEENREQGGRQELQLTVKRRTGRAVQVNLTLSLVMDNEQLLWIFDLEDLTPIMALQHEKELLRNEMGRVSKLADIGRLTGGIAHELNNPLAILQGLAENISDLVSTNQLTKEKINLELLPMQQTIDRMTRIIQSMMSIARGEDPVVESLAVSDVWMRASAGFQSLDQLQGIKVINEISPDLTIAVDSIRVEQIFVNLVKNAIHALQTVPAGQREIRVSTSEKNDRINIHVENNGPPIAEKVGENIYTPFFTTKPVGEGFGLGLFLAYNVMKAHGGALSHENIKPHGVRFTLTFPKKRSMALRRTKHRLLIVDDEALFRQMFARKLEGLGFQVTMARDGGEAMIAIQQGQTFDMMITDYRMPGLDGAGLVEEVRRLSNMPILLVTGYANDKAVKRMKDRGFIQGILQKPVQDENLIKALEELLKIKIAVHVRAG